MKEKSDKFLNLDEFKEKVYKNIGTLESLEDLENKKEFSREKIGCLGIFIAPLVSFGNRKWRERQEIRDLYVKADGILADQKIKDLLCEKIDATITLPIDAAYKLTPVLYALALEDEEKVPFDTMLFAIICRKIVKQGVENFCAAKEKTK